MRFKIILILTLLSASLTSFADVQVEQKTSIITIKTSAVEITAAHFIENIDSSITIIEPRLKVGSAIKLISDMQNIAPEGICKIIGKTEAVSSDYTKQIAEEKMASINGDGIFIGYERVLFSVSSVLCR